MSRVRARSGNMSGVARFRSQGWGPGCGALALCLTVLAACQDSDGESGAEDSARAAGATQVLRLSVETAPGVVEFDKKRLTARAGRIAFELTNRRRRGHNIRIHTGDRCCFRPGSRDIGGTRTIGTGRTRVVLDLQPGTYTYLCSTGGHWRTQHGTLVVR
jgi:plastocyanin